MDNSPSENIKVFLRIKPAYNSNAPCISASTSIVSNPVLNSKCSISISDEDENSVVFSGTKNEVFTYDMVKGPTCTQFGIFDAFGRNLTDCCLMGYNATVFAYGQTGSGKTYTMQGPTCSAINEANGIYPDEETVGLIPRILEHLFARINQQEEQSCGRVKFYCKCSFVEIYNETVFDLLEQSSPPCLLREDPEKGVYLEGSTIETIVNSHQAYQLFLEGTKNRTVSETSMNRESSRSHSVFTIYVQSRVNNGDNTVVCDSRFNLVDLAGSERQSQTATVGIRLKEAGNINKSLMALGQVINALLDIGNGRQRHVPYRDSKLTFLLRDSLGGNTKTVIIANVNPLMSCMAESLSTLRFAQRAKLIVNKAIVNQDCLVSVSKLKLEVKRLENEVEALRNLNQDLINRSHTINLQSESNDSNHAEPMLQIVPLASSSALKSSLDKIMVLNRERETMLQQIDLLEETLKRKDHQLQTERMIFKFKEKQYVDIETMLRNSDIEAAVAQKIAILENELDEYKKMMLLNPDVTRFAYENLLLREQLERMENIKETEQINCDYVRNLEETLNLLLLQKEEAKLLVGSSSAAFVDLLTPEGSVTQISPIQESPECMKVDSESCQHEATSSADFQHEISVLNERLLTYETENQSLANQVLALKADLITAKDVDNKLSVQSDNLAELLLKASFLEQEKQDLADSCASLKKHHITFLDEFHGKMNEFACKMKPKIHQIVECHYANCEKAFSAFSVLLHKSLVALESSQFEIQKSKTIHSQLQGKYVKEKQTAFDLTEKLHELESRTSDLQNINANLESMCVSFKQSIDLKIVELDALKLDYLNLTTNYNVLKDGHLILEKSSISQINSLTEQNQSLQTQNESIAKSVESYVSKNKDLSEALKEASSQLDLKDTEIDRLKVNSEALITSLQSELEEYKKGWSEMKDEIRILQTKYQQFKTQYRLSVEDNENLMSEIVNLQSRLKDLENTQNAVDIAKLNEMVIDLEKTVMDHKSELKNLQQENERLIQHHNVQQKLQYHVKIKQENNELRKLLKDAKDELNKFRGQGKEISVDLPSN